MGLLDGVDLLAARRRRGGGRRLEDEPARPPHTWYVLTAAVSTAAFPFALIGYGTSDPSPAAEAADEASPDEPETIEEDDADFRRFERYVHDALAGVPEEFRARLDNVDVVIEEEPPLGEEDRLGFYSGTPLTVPGKHWRVQLPTRITIYRGPLERLHAGDDEGLRLDVERTVRHEIAHHFGISDERLVELDRY